MDHCRQLPTCTDGHGRSDSASRARRSGAERAGGTQKCPIDRYEYPQQDTNIRRGDKLRVVDGDVFGKVDSVDRAGRTIDVKKASSMKEVPPPAFFAHTVIDDEVMAESLYRFGDRPEVDDQHTEFRRGCGEFSEAGGP